MHKHHLLDGMGRVWDNLPNIVVMLCGRAEVQIPTVGLVFLSN